MKSSREKLADESVKSGGKWSFFSKWRSSGASDSSKPLSPPLSPSDMTTLSPPPLGNSELLSPDVNGGALARKLSSNSIFKEPELLLDYPETVGQSDLAKFVLASEIEALCLDTAYELLQTSSQYRKHFQDDLAEWTMSQVAAKAYQIVSANLPPVHSHPVWNLPAYEMSLVLQKTRAVIDSALDQIKRKKMYVTTLSDLRSVVKPLKRAVGRTSRWSETGTRETNEDRHVAFPYLHELVGRDNPSSALSFYAVYDGHGGVECAKFVSMNLHVNFAKHAYFSGQTDASMRQVIIDSFMNTNKQWHEKVARCGFPITSGSTAIAAAIQDRNLYVAWAGDSSAMLFLKNGIWLDFVLPHKPVFESEKNRIINLGGYVQSNRVNGVLAVSRSFGDFKYGCVNPEPDILEYTLTGNEDFLLLACDGLTDVMEAADILNTVKKSLDKTSDPDEISRLLVEEALMRGSSDNVSVVYIPLDLPADMPISAESNTKTSQAVPSVPSNQEKMRMTAETTRTTTSLNRSTNTQFSVSNTTFSTKSESLPRVPFKVAENLKPVADLSSTSALVRSVEKQAVSEDDHDWGDEDTPPEMADGEDRPPAALTLPSDPISLAVKSSNPSLNTTPSQPSIAINSTVQNTSSPVTVTSELSSVAINISPNSTRNRASSSSAPKPQTQAFKPRPNKQALSELAALSMLSKQLASLSTPEEGK